MNGRIVVFGAGSIGCYVGGALAAAGGDVVLVARPRIAAELAQYGLRLRDWRGHDIVLAPGTVRCVTDAVALTDAALVLLTVKSDATAEAADAIALHAPDGVTVLSLQNGVDNVATLRHIAPRMHVVAGVVPFNVAHQGEGRFVRATEGELMVADDPGLARWTALFERARLPLRRVTDIRAVQWGKLLLNLNNPVNALSGLPLSEQLSQRDYRRAVALLMREGLSALRAAGIAPARASRLPSAWLPSLLELPDALFRRLAARMLAIDPAARSSMADDLARGRRSEIDHLCGAIVRLAARHGGIAPANERMIALIREAEAGGRRAWTGRELYRALRAA